jgi:hypothetical protein
MAQTNYTPISLYYSTTASAVPTAANLVPGELAINTADGKLYYEDSAGVVQVLATKSTGSIGGSNTQVQFNNSGSLGGSSSFTWDGTTVTATKFAGALNGTVGATTASTGAFTTLTSNGATTFTAGTASTSTTTGTTVITGGLGVSGRINAANFDGIVGANTAAAGSFTNLAYTGTLTGGTGIVNLGSGQFYKDASGNVGIGTTSPGGNAANRVVKSTGTTSSQFQAQSSAITISLYADASQGIVDVAGAFPLYFATNSAERMRITSAGLVGIGTTSPDALLSVNGIGSFGDGAAATPSIAHFGDLNTGFWFPTADTIAASTAGSERVRINSSGTLFVGATSFASAGKVHIGFDGSAVNGLTLQTTFGSTGSNYLAFYNSAGTLAGTINQNGTTTVAYSTSSDYRLKENIAPMTGALATVAQLKPVTYKWKSNGSYGQGFIAHELQAIVPDCVTGKKDAVDANGNPKYQGIDTSFLVATLTAAIQELKAEFDAYKATHP